MGWISFATSISISELKEEKDKLKSPFSALSRSLDFIVTRSGGYKAGYDFVNGKYEFKVKS